MSDQTDISKGTVLLDFWAPWCGPCKMLMPQIEELKKELNDVIVYKCNIDTTPEVAVQYKVRSVPCFVLLKDGKEQNRISGTVSIAQIREMLQ